MKILMVCLGNICRSPLGEGILQHKANKAGLDWIVDSAGTGNYHIGEPPHRLSQKVAKLNGVEICDQKCRQFVKGDMAEFDKIYAMDSDVYNDIQRISRELWDPSKTDLLMNEVYPGSDMDVPDPWFGGEKDFHEVYHMISKACDAIIKKASPNLPKNRDGGALKKQLY
ncbi:MAG TPA: low molecular weight protein-tyrosine-phosphatase [Parafilimonas sp.]|nr:low molecular weight protein-tyrosine-phosphatase [Parafilimonas sp.]